MKPVFDATVDKQIESEVRTIKAEFEGRLTAESIDLAAHESIERLAGSRVPQFVPLFVGRFTRERLRLSLITSVASAEARAAPLGCISHVSPRPVAVCRHVRDLGRPVPADPGGGG